MAYMWISDNVKHVPQENKCNPWSVDYVSARCIDYPNMRYGTMYFKTLNDAWDWISGNKVDYPF
jgi:hypothetical protein